MCRANKQGPDLLLRRLNYSHIDAVIVSISPMCTTAMSLRRLLYFYNFRTIYYVIPHASSDCPALAGIDSRVICVAEDEMLPPNITRESLVSPCTAVTRNKPLGWYVQQFVKLGVARTLPKLSEYYLVWDADNIPVYVF